MIEVEPVDATSTIKLLGAIEALYPMLALIHVFLDNARIERLWGLMHRNVTHNKCYASCAQLADATPQFPAGKVPRNLADLCDSLTDQFARHQPKGFTGHDVNRVYPRLANASAIRS
jgi:hypothetical protein